VSRLVGRALAAGLLAALCAAAWLALFYAIHPAVFVDFDTDPPRLLRGVHPPERDHDSGLTFAWTQQEMSLRLPGLDRSSDWVMEMRVRAARPDRNNPELSFFADGVHLETRRSATDFETVTVTIPANRARLRGALITMRASSTFVPGPGDARQLGVMIDSIELRPTALVLPPRRAFVGVVGSAAILGAAVALIGVTPASAVAAAIVLSAGAASQIASGFAPHTDYPMTVLKAAMWIGLLLVVMSRAVERWQGLTLRNTARFAAAFSAGALFFKLIVLLHPGMPIGDAMFHAHRFQGVLGGNIYFTSIAPGGYLFPYAPGLYVFAAPFAGLVARGAADMTLLRVIVLAADAAAGILLYVMIVRAWGDRRAAAIAVALYHFIPLDFRIVTTGNLTNAFAQSLSVVALAMLTAPQVRLQGWIATGVLTVVLAAAFMSHTSTFPLLFAASVLTAGLFAWRGGRELRSTAGAVVVATAVALVLSVIIYYSHFGDTYRSEFARIGSETATAAPDAGGRGISQRLGIVPYYVEQYFGVAVLLLAAIGARQMWTAGRRDRLTLATAGWALSCLLFLGLGILTPVDMRYYLASIPAIAIMAAYGASSLWSRGGPARGVAVALLGWSIWAGTSFWLSVF
jgi:hypothetical protein